MGRPCLLLALVCLLAGILSTASLNPGFQFRVSSKGLSYANEVAIGILSKKLLAVQIPNQHDKHYDINNIKVTKFHPPTSGISLVPAKGLHWSISNAAVEVTADWHVTPLLVHYHGSLTATASGVSMSVDLALGRDGSGHPTLTASNCHADIAHLPVHLSGGFATKIFQLLVNIFDGKIKNLLRDQICDQAVKFANGDGAHKLATLPLQAGFLGKFDLDYSLLAPPAFTAQFVEVSNKGLVYWHGDHHEPPGSCPALPASHPTTSMAEIWVTECLANSMAFAAHSHHFLHYTLNDLPTGARNFLKTSCATGVCMGTLFPEVAHKYPNAQASISLDTTRAPTLSISKGLATLHVAGKADLAVSSHSLFSVSLDLALSLSTSIQKDHLVVQLGKLVPKVSVTTSSVGTLALDKVQKMIEVIVSDHLIPQINHAGAQGLPLPVTGVVNLINPHIQLMDKAILVSTDLKYLG